MTITFIDSSNRIELPESWIKDLGLHDQVVLERTGEGILVRPCLRTTWDEIFANKLAIGSARLEQKEDAGEVTGDDFLF